MTVTVTSTFVRAAGNNVTTVVNFPFLVTSSGDLVVRDILDSTGTPTTLTLNTHYTVHLSATGEGGTVTFLSALVSGHTYDIRSNIPATQGEDIRNQGRFLPEVHEGVFDKAVRLIQDLTRKVGQSIQAPDYEASAPNFTLPNALQRALNYLAFDVNGNTVVTSGTGGGDASLRNDLANTTTAGKGNDMVSYRRTPAEIAASVTPTNYAYAPGDVRRYGAVGDGTTDSTAALIRAMASMDVGGVLEFEPSGMYMVHVNGAHTLVISGKTNFHIRGNNATIKVFNADPVAGSDEVLFFTGCTDGTIENLTIDGNRANRTPAVTTAHNIEIRNSCARLTFRKVRSINAVMDGWSIETSTESVQASYPTDILLEDCEGTNAYRSNLSLIATIRCKVRGGRYTSANGSAPQTGIDVEPNPTTTYGNADFSIEDVEVSGNTGPGLQITVSGGVGVNSGGRIRKLRGSSNPGGLLVVAVAQDLEVDGVMCGTHASVARGLIDFQTGGTIVDVTLRNLTFLAQPGLSTTVNYCIFDQGTITGRYMIDGVKANSIACHLMQVSSEASVMNVVAKSVTADAAIQVGVAGCIFRNIDIDTCSGRALYTNVPVEIDGASFIDAASATAAAQFDTGSAGSIVRNVTVRQRTAIPGGAVGLYFNDAPRLVENVLAKSAGTDYTAANIFNFAGGTVGATVLGCAPNPFSAAPTVTPGTVANGGGYNQVVAVAGVAFGDQVYAAPGVDMGALTYQAYVSSPGNVRIAISNTSGGGITPGSSTWKIVADKRA